MARPTAANRTVRRGATASRSLVAPRSGGVAYTVELDVRTAFDFVLSINANAWEGRSEELLPEDRRWLTEAMQEAGEALSDPIAFGASATHGVVRELSFLIAQHPETRTAADVVRLLDETPNNDVLRALTNDLLAHEALRPSLERVLAGDRTALDEFHLAWTADHADMPLAEALRDPDAAIDRLRVGLRAWLPPFQAVEERVGRMLARDADDRRVDLESMPAPDAIERTTGGLRWLAERQVERVVLAPTYFGRPYNWLFGTATWRLIVYPIWDETLDAVDRFAPPHAAVRLYRALGDDTRLRILRMLVDRDLYLTEIAQRLELSKPTVKHHLTQLRTAGLVTVTEEGGLTYYSLRPSRIAEAGPELGRFLGI